MHTHVIISPKYGSALVHVDDCDADLFQGVTWGARFVRGGTPHCIAHQNGGRAILLHREIVKRAYPAIKLDRWMLVDHKNGNPFDNRRENLRICSNAQNTRNSGVQKNGTNPHPGVYLIKETGRWRALIIPDGKRIHLGVFDTPGEAIAARQAAERAHYGEFAFSNRLTPAAN